MMTTNEENNEDSGDLFSIPTMVVKRKAMGTKNDDDCNDDDEVF